MGGAGPGAPPPIPGVAIAGAPLFLAIDGKQHGPFELPLVVGKARSGELSPETLVWRSGMNEWTAAKDVPELAGAFGGGDGPPPMPR